MKMKLCIITLVDYKNYGNRLQHFAHQMLLQSEGYHTISWTEYVLKEDFRSNVTTVSKRMMVQLLSPKWLAISNRLINRYHLRKLGFQMLARSSAMQTFTEKYIEGRCSIYADTIDDVRRIADQSNIDFFIVGSDQVWNSSWKVNGYYFLNFVPPEKRLSFAASIGINEIPPEQRTEYAKYLNQMRYISVREQRAVEIVKELTGRDATLTLDPTLLLPQRIWDKYIDVVQLELPEKYICTYFLGEIPMSVQEFSTRKGLPIIALNDRNQREWYAIDPLQFVYVIKHADYVLTDSFHGMAFSIKYAREFYVFRRKGYNYDMFSRIETLTNMFDFGARIQGDESIIEDTPISAEKWRTIEEKLEKERVRAMEGLKNAMQ